MILYLCTFPHYHTSSFIKTHILNGGKGNFKTSSRSMIHKATHFTQNFADLHETYGHLWDNGHIVWKCIIFTPISHPHTPTRVCNFKPPIPHQNVRKLATPLFGRAATPGLPLNHTSVPVEITLLETCQALLLWICICLYTNPDGPNAWQLSMRVISTGTDVWKP